MTTTGSPPIHRPAATPLASSSVAQVSTRMACCLSSEASTLFWCVSGTLNTQPSGSCRPPPRASRKTSVSVSMISDAGIDSGIGASRGRSVPFVQQGKRAGDVGRGDGLRGVQERAIERGHAIDPEEGEADADLFLQQL